MIDLYYAPTPNGWKITIMLEESFIPYQIIPVNLGKGDQFKPEFLEISPKRTKVLEWLFWQVGGLGPMAGQVSHFVNYAPNFPGDHSYAEKRYKNEYDRLLGVMNNVLLTNEYLAGD